MIESNIAMRDVFISCRKLVEKIEGTLGLLFPSHPKPSPSKAEAFATSRIITVGMASFRMVRVEGGSFTGTNVWDVPCAPRRLLEQRREVLSLVVSPQQRP